MTKPLVSILIPAYNAEQTISQTLQSAVAQTWAHTEIIVVDDGSTDRTADIVRRFGSKVTLVSQENQGMSDAMNSAYRISRGDYIQELDADDVLMPDKIERQLAALRPGDTSRLLLSSAWAPFYHRTSCARFVRNSLCQDLSPVEWIVRKMEDNTYMQNATFLMSRELAEAAGPWPKHLHYDQDGEYFARVLLASEGTRFVEGTGVFYRQRDSSRVSYIGNSDRKKDSMLISMKLQIQYLQSLEESERTRRACLTYLQNWYGDLVPGRPDILAEMQSLAAQLQGHLEEQPLSWKYAWIKPILGKNTAKRASKTLPALKASAIRRCDKVLYELGTRGAV
jgi:glycosyltransferase involved in cell wall biosynthesis